MLLQYPYTIRGITNNLELLQHWKQLHGKKELYFKTVECQLQYTVCTDICKFSVFSCIFLQHCLQCFDTAGWRGRKGIRPVKTEWWGAGVVICLERDADSHMAQLMPLPLTVSCFSKIQMVFTFLVLAHPGSPGKRAVKRVCVPQH